MTKTTGSPALDDLATAKSGPEADSPKRHGDKFGAVAATGPEPASPEPRAGDSQKPHGDPLRHAVDPAAEKR